MMSWHVLFWDQISETHQKCVHMRIHMRVCTSTQSILQMHLVGYLTPVPDVPQAQSLRNLDLNVVRANVSSAESKSKNRFVLTKA